MAFKSKLNPEELQKMTLQEYIKATQKEAKRAKKFGRIGVVVLSDFVFSCGNTSSLLILGKLSGPLLKFYKTQKRSRAKEKDYAKGSCYFEAKDDGSVELHIALNDGKARPASLKMENDYLKN